MIRSKQSDEVGMIRETYLIKTKNGKKFETVEKANGCKKRCSKMVSGYEGKFVGDR